MSLSPENLRDRLACEVLVADGAMGTVLHERGVVPGHPYEHACLTHPDLVRDVHAEYVRAGARLLETNTFGANRVKLVAASLDDQARAINLAAARLAREAAGRDVLVAGAIGPCGKSLTPLGTLSPGAAEAAFREQAEALLEGGVDLFLLETFIDVEEMRLAWQVVRSLGDIPVVAQKVFIEDGETLGGGLPDRVAAEAAAWAGVAAVGSNCAVGPQRMLDIVRAMASSTSAPVSAMPTPGLPQLVGSHIRYAVTPEYFAHYARQLADAGAALVGGCCGTTPAHIAAVARALSGRKPTVHGASAAIAVRSREAAPAAEAALPSDHSLLRRKIGKQYVKTVELDLPRGLDVNKVLLGAEALRDRGVDAIDISDGARARLRMNPTAVAHLVQERAGIEVMMHFACRDRNLLAVQADLLGAHALGIRNILAVTGDPAVVGDYPTATSVFDVDSIGLIRVLRRFNDGIDFAGNSIGRATAFTVAAAFDPLATDPVRERERLARKVEEGADLIYTQPVFESAVLDTAVEATAQLKVPLVFGLLPLRSGRHAEFMHNEVPGISIPDQIRARIAELDDEDARAYGIDVARQFLLHACPLTQGVYLMPPFGNHRVAEAVLKVLD